MVDVTHFRGFRAGKRASQPVPAGAQPTILTDKPQPAVRAGHFSNGQIAALFVVLAAIASVPVLLYPWPPLGDYINHLSRMHVIATIRSVQVTTVVDVVDPFDTPAAPVHASHEAGYGHGV